MRVGLVGLGTTKRAPTEARRDGRQLVGGDEIIYKVACQMSRNLGRDVALQPVPAPDRD